MRAPVHNGKTAGRISLLVGAAALVVSLAVVLPALAATPRPAAPTTSGLTLTGKRLSLAEFRGKPVMLNVWSSW